MSDVVRKIDNYAYDVKSRSVNKFYRVLYDGKSYSCDCPRFEYVGECRHIRSVEMSPLNTTNIRKNVIDVINENICPFCDCLKITKCGIRKNRNYNVQIFKCKNCLRRFSTNVGFKKMSASPETITNALQLYFTGESLRNTKTFLEMQGVKVSHKTVWNWINKYINLMDKYIETLTPKVSDKWRTDELYLRIKGKRKYLYSMMDDETRYWIARQVSTSKYTQDVIPMFRESVKIAKKKPKVLISDGARNFMQAHKKEWYSRYGDEQVEHIRHIHFKGDKNNNKMERLNGTIRDREKVMRGLKKMDTPIIKGIMIHHNFIRQHSGINNDTPSERAGIVIRGSNKWKTIIQQASTL